MPSRQNKKQNKKAPASNKANRQAGKPEGDGEIDLRVIGGTLRGSKLQYGAHTEIDSEELVTRPMKHRVREAIFNLVSFDAKGKHAFDLFAGTGAIGIEAISRGAVGTTFIERHIPTSRVIEANLQALGLEEQCTLLVTSAFLWTKRDLPTYRVAEPWLVFVSPPYSFYIDREAEMLSLINAYICAMPDGSTIVVEADRQFDFEKLDPLLTENGCTGEWDVREYAPAVVGVWRKQAEG